MPAERMRNLRTIVLNEDFKAVSRPELHARGLIPFCIQNPHLRIERRIGLFTNLLPQGFYCSHGSNTGFPWLLTGMCFRVMIPWIEEALALSSLGMPIHSFTLVIDGSTEEASKIWNLLKYAAATQEAQLEQRRLNGASTPSRPLVLEYNSSWDLPADFAKTIRDIVEGTSVVRFDGDVGELWDAEVFFHERRNWGQEQWDRAWFHEVTCHEIRTEFFQHAKSRYRLSPRALRTTHASVGHGEDN